MLDIFAHDGWLPRHDLRTQVSRSNGRESHGFRGLSSCGWTDDYQLDDVAGPHRSLSEIN
jgi:hypothetical protein